MDIGFCYTDGEDGFPQDHVKAFEHFLRAGELGSSRAFNTLGFSYDLGEGVEMDKKKANHYWELAAMAGDVDARFNLGSIEQGRGNMDRALKHYMIAVESGGDVESLKRIKGLVSSGTKLSSLSSLKQIKRFFVKGHASKDDYVIALRANQAYC